MDFIPTLRLDCGLLNLTACSRKGRQETFCGSASAPPRSAAHGGPYHASLDIPSLAAENGADCARKFWDVATLMRSRVVWITRNWPLRRRRGVKSRSARLKHFHSSLSRKGTSSYCDLGTKLKIDLSDETRDLLASIRGNCGFSTPCGRTQPWGSGTSFRDCQKLYVDELPAGN